MRAQLPQPRLVSGDADGDPVSQRQHAFEEMHSDVRLGIPQLYSTGSAGGTLTASAQCRSVRERSASPITCLNLPMAVSAWARFVGAVAATSLGTAVGSGGAMIAAAG